ncbi:MAG: EpsG family protein [Erysipelotrichaceae bacterium]|nr:EpsG family protein [Erysipelotrichaceae bacterium]
MGKERTVVTWWFAILVVIPLIIMAVNRDQWIGDTGQYINTYKKMPSGFSAIPEFYSGIKKDKAFYVLECIVKCTFGSDYKICFLIIAIIQTYGLIRLYRKYSSDYITAILLFVLSTDYVSWMHNGTRQFVAVSICLLAIDYILEKKYIPAIVIVLIASRFHQTALLVIPVIFIVQGEPWNWKTLIFILLIVLAIAFVDQFTNMLDYALDETQYENVVSDWQSWNDDGTNPLRVLIYSLPAILSLIGLKYIRKENDTTINLATNMSIIASGLYLISMVTSGIFIGRLPIYVSLYSQGILLPWEVDHIFNRKSSTIIKSSMVAFYIVFYIYQINRWGFF